MIQPLTFGFDEQTARTNSFQTQPVMPRADVLHRANQEFNGMVHSLRAHGIFVQAYQDVSPGEKPSAVFPNNWISMWPDGKVYLYPMATKSRRIEKSTDVLRELADQFVVNETIDLSDAESRQHYLEGTGAIVFDHLQKIMYGCVSDRCDQQLFNQHAKTLGYRPVIFHAYDTMGNPIYHTNVMMGVQANTAVICAESITDDDERVQVLACLVATKRQVVQITRAQMAAFCGNVLELQNDKGEHFLAMSQSAYDNFTQSERDILAKDKELLPFSIPTIEAIGGGSVRCMLAEVFLRRAGNISVGKVTTVPAMDMVK